jgi:hypothetical protein
VDYVCCYLKEDTLFGFNYGAVLLAVALVVLALFAYSVVLIIIWNSRIGLKM